MKQSLYTFFRYLYSLLVMGRPLFLLGTTPLYILGVAAAWNDMESLRVSELVIGLILVWLVQLMTHYNNEFCDLETDRATGISTYISGGSRVLLRGLIPPVTAHVAAIVSLLLAAILTLMIILFFNIGTLFLALVIPCFFVGWFYSAQPIKLVSRGMGEISIVIVTCFLLPLTAYYLQTSTMTMGMIAPGIPIGLFTFALILTTELPDIDADALTGKMTLSARLGFEKTMTFQFISFCSGYICFIITTIYMLESWAWAAILLSTPMAAAVIIMARSQNISQIATIEKLGIGTSLMVGYTSLLFCITLFLG